MKREKGPRTWAVGHDTLPPSSALDDGALTWGDPSWRILCCLGQRFSCRSHCLPFIHIYPQLLHLLPRDDVGPRSSPALFPSGRYCSLSAVIVSRPFFSLCSPTLREECQDSVIPGVGQLGEGAGEGLGLRLALGSITQGTFWSH